MCIYQVIELGRIAPLNYEVHFDTNPAIEFPGFSLDFEIFDQYGKLIKTLPFNLGTVSYINNLDVELEALQSQYGIMDYKVKSHHMNGVLPVTLVLAYGNIIATDSDNSFEDFY